MRFIFTVFAVIITLTTSAMAKDLVPMESVTLAPGLSVITPCQTASIPYTLQQCVIYEVRLPGDAVDVKKFTFDIPKKLQFQAQEVGFVLRVSSVAPVSHLALEIPNDIRVRWIGLVPPTLITVPEDTAYDISFISHDGGVTWEATIMISKMDSPRNFHPTQTNSPNYRGYNQDQAGSGFIQRVAPNTYQSFQNFGAPRSYGQQQQSPYADRSYYNAP